MGQGAVALGCALGVAYCEMLFKIRGHLIRRINVFFFL